MNKKNSRWLIILGVILLIGLILVALILGWFARRGKVFDSRPLVLIVSPENYDQFQTGDGILIQATAREDNGLSRMEIWVNDIMVDALDAEIPGTTNLDLLSSWVPTSEGRQRIIVRATSSDGVDGQAMIEVYATASSADGTGTYIIEDGDTLDSVAEDHGSTPEELEDLNPGMDPGGLAPGDELIVPDTEPAADGGLPPVDDGGDPPPADPDPPLAEFPLSIVEMVRLNADEMATLRLEVTALRTWEEYEKLHCYVGLADLLPQWYPDRDRNQATDESFEKLGRGWWNTDETMQGDTAPVISWPEDQPLPASIYCVGITGEGTEAVDLTKVDLEIHPDQWGSKYQVTVEGEGGRLLVETRVTQMITPVRMVPKELDSDMTVPTNVHLNGEDRTLEWEYYPEADETPIDGFRIYLNSTMQWAVDEDTWETRLPTEWFDPPCGEPYVFSVTAFRIEGDDWPESYHGRTQLAQVDCTRQVEVTFLTLQTYDLGGDGRYEDRHGDKGPAYGAFSANRVGVEFDGGREGRGAVLDLPNGLSHNTTYDLFSMAGDPGWRFTNSEPLVVTEVPVDGVLRVGVGIMDRDTGRCRYEGDNGCDDRICAGRHPPITFDELIAAEGEVLHSEFTTRDGRCRVEFEYRLVEDSSGAGLGNEGIEPLPWLHFIDLDVDPISGETAVEIQNLGTGEWAGLPLTVELQTPDGASLGQTIFEDIYIPVNDYQTVTIPSTSEEPIFDVCVFLDPEDEVLELYERTGGALRHYPICPGLPDLVIQEAAYENLEGEWIRATIQNIGSDDLENRVTTFEIRYPGRGPMTDPFVSVPLTIPAGESFEMRIGPLDEVVRPRMAEGYEIEINSDRSIAEESYENNLFEVEEGTELAVYTSQIHVPYDRGDEAGVTINIYTGSLSGHARNREIVEWNIRDIDWDQCSEDDNECIITYNDGEYYQPWFDIHRDETLIVVATFLQPDTDWRTTTETRIFYPPEWNAGDINRPWGYCAYEPSTPEGIEFVTHGVYPTHYWEVEFKFCRENYGEEPGD